MSGPVPAPTPAQALAAVLATGRDSLGFADDPGREARRLLAHAAGVEPGALLTLGPGDFTEEVMSRYAALLARRARREPMAQILGYRDFHAHRFRVTADVLDPRPETETVVRAALEAPFSRMLDLGTGTGCILLSLLAARPGAEGLGTDISEAALAVARRNAADLGLAGRARFALSDWLAGLEGRFDLIVANPPYIAAAEMPGLAPEIREWEPHAALTDGDDGLSAYRAIARGAPAHLAPGGRLIVEVGAGQADAVAGLFAAAGFVEPTIRHDLDGRARAVVALAPGGGTVK